MNGRAGAVSDEDFQSLFPHLTLAAVRHLRDQATRDANPEPAHERCIHRIGQARPARGRRARRASRSGVC